MSDSQHEVAAYLRGLAGADEHETHISRVFVGADTVWKLKKAVKLPFLDFSSLASRRHFLLRELALNAAAAPAMYRDVVAVVRGPDGSPAIAAQPADDDEVLDWVLRMARVPAQDFFESLVARGALTEALLVRTADVIAAFHTGLPPAAAQGASSLHAVAEGNAESALRAGLPAERVRGWLSAMLHTLAGLGEWQAARQRDGFVRRTHGDLHLGNLCLWHGAPVLFDALEFDEAMATTDVGYDLAFLLMDLDVQVGREAANLVLNRYVARTGDIGLCAGLAAFISMRAMVRAHIQAARGQADAARYLGLAEAALRPSAPVLMAIGGLQGTGKSTLARALAPTLGAVPGALVLRSDECRKRLCGVAPEDRLPEGGYTPAMNQAVNAALLHDAARTVSAGHAVILDATFLDPAQRGAVAAVAAEERVRFLGFWLAAPLAVLEARVAARRGDASDATAEVLRQSAASHPDPPGGAWRTIDATARDTALEAAQAALRATPGPC